MSIYKKSEYKYLQPKSKFVYADGMTLEQVEYHNLMSRPALSKAERNSLVKRFKSPTVQKPKEKPRDLSVYEPIREIEDFPDPFLADSKGPGRYTVISYREWSNEYRVRTKVEVPYLKPPLQSGNRVSEMLTRRAARKITESCYYMAKCHDGYKTFVTGTFREDIRKKIANGATTIQKEVARTMDALQKMYQRGWTDSSGERIPGHESLLQYCWVVEIPKNENGEDNPHVHMMLGWRVPNSQFKDWSKRIEGIWGNGYFHMEKIKDPLCAGAYMAKAAGYITKASNQDDQGKVVGNRYGISSTARAPGWLEVSEAELGIMGQIIHETHEACMKKNKPLYDKRDNLRDSLKYCPKDKIKMRRIIGAKLQAVREEISEIPIVTSKYQLIFKNSEELMIFMAKSLAKGWDAYYRPVSLWYSKVYELIKKA